MSKLLVRRRSGSKGAKHYNDKNSDYRFWRNREANMRWLTARAGLRSAKHLIRPKHMPLPNLDGLTPHALYLDPLRPYSNTFTLIGYTAKE